MRKKILCAVLSLLMVVSMLPIVVGADETSVLDLAFTQRETAVGATEVSVGVDMSGNPGLVSATIPVKWDNSVLHLKSVTPSTDILEAGWCGMSMSEYTSNGTYYLAWDNDLASQDYTTTTGCLAELVFTIVDPDVDTSTELKFDLTDERANIMNYSMVDLTETITVTAGAKVVNVTAKEAGGDTPDPDPEPSGFYIEAGSIKGKAGDTVEVPITLYNNPGITVLIVVLEYPENLEFVEIVDMGVLGTNTHPQTVTGNTFNLYWHNDTATDDFVVNDVVAKIKFKISDSAEEDDQYTIKLSTVDFGVLNSEADEIACEFVNGIVNVISYIVGDIDGDGKPATPKDAMYLARYIAGWDGYDKLIDINGTDIDGDGKPATPKDAMYLARYIAGWDGYDKLPIDLGK